MRRKRNMPERLQKILCYEGDTPTPLVRSILGWVVWTVRSTQRVGKQYAKILLYRTQTSIFTLKRFNFTKKHNKRDLQSQITLIISNACFARAFFGSYKLKH